MKKIVGAFEMENQKLNVINFKWNYAIKVFMSRFFEIFMIILAFCAVVG